MKADLGTVDELVTYLGRTDFPKPQKERVVLFLMDEVDPTLLRDATLRVRGLVEEVLSDGQMHPGTSAFADHIDTALRENKTKDLAVIVYTEFYAEPRYKRAVEKLLGREPRSSPLALREIDLDAYPVEGKIEPK